VVRQARCRGWRIRRCSSKVLPSQHFACGRGHAAAARHRVGESTRQRWLMIERFDNDRSVSAFVRTRRRYDSATHRIGRLVDGETTDGTAAETIAAKTIAAGAD
jgi:hypothetical protein